MSDAAIIAKIDKAILDLASKGAPTEITINGDTLKLSSIKDLLELRDKYQKRETLKSQGIKGGIIQAEFDS